MSSLTLPFSVVFKVRWLGRMVAWSFEDSVTIPGWWLNLEGSRQDSSIICLYFLSAPMIDTVPPLVKDSQDPRIKNGNKLGYYFRDFRKASVSCSHDLILTGLGV